MRRRSFLAWILVCCVLMGLMVGCGPRETLEELLEQGGKYLSEGNYEEAIVAFEKAIKADDKSVEAYLGLSDAHIGLGDLKSAVAKLEEGLNATGDEHIRVKLSGLRKRMEDSDGDNADAAGTNPSVSYLPTTERAMTEAIYDKVVAGRTFAEIKADYGPVVAVVEGREGESIGVRHEKTAGILYYRAQMDPGPKPRADYRTAEEIPDYAYCYEQRFTYDELLPNMEKYQRPVFDLDQLSALEIIKDAPETEEGAGAVSWVQSGKSTDEYTWYFHFKVNPEDGKAVSDEAVAIAWRIVN